MKGAHSQDRELELKKYKPMTVHSTICTFRGRSGFTAATMRLLSSAFGAPKQPPGAPASLRRTSKRGCCAGLRREDYDPATGTCRRREGPCHARFGRMMSPRLELASPPATRPAKLMGWDGARTPSSATSTSRPASLPLLDRRQGPRSASAAVALSRCCWRRCALEGGGRGEAYAIRTLDSGRAAGRCPLPRRDAKARPRGGGPPHHAPPFITRMIEAREPSW